MSGIVEGTSRRAPVRLRIANKRVLALVKAFVKAGIFGHDGRCATTPGGAAGWDSFPCWPTRPYRGWMSTLPTSHTSADPVPDVEDKAEDHRIHPQPPTPPLTGL
jgi:hypothetical protein